MTENQGLGLGGVFDRVDREINQTPNPVNPVIKERKAAPDLVQAPITQVAPIQPVAPIQAVASIPVAAPVTIQPEVIKPRVEAPPIAKPPGLDFNSPGMQEFAKLLGTAIQNSNAAQPGAIVQDSRALGYANIITGGKNYRKNARRITHRKLLSGPQAYLMIPMNSPLLPKSPNDTKKNKELAKYSISINLVSYTIPANKQILVPLKIFTTYTLQLLSKTRGKAAFAEYQEVQKLISTHTFYKERGLVLHDATGVKWDVSVMNKESVNYNKIECENMISRLMSN
jgi:hypothetical protein